MNLDSASSSGAPQNPRSSRGQIAQQACETCRQRKQKCDEQRPKCSLCQRMKIECRYREPQPTKKDKTLVEILEKLKTIESKVDRIPTNRMPAGFGSLQPSPSSQPSFNPENDASSYSASSFRPSPNHATNRSPPYRHTSAAHQILTWPAILQLLRATSLSLQDFQNPGQDGSAFLVQLQKAMQLRGIPNLPLDDALPERPFFGMQSQDTRLAGGARITFPALPRDQMHRLASAYFDTFNLLYPFMDRQAFTNETLTKVSSEGFDGDKDSVLALLVFALGEVALDGYSDVGGYKGRSSGIRGGPTTKPPGLALFNEARKTIGFVLTDCDLENVQIFSLAALYYQACSRHVVSMTGGEPSGSVGFIPNHDTANGAGSNPIDWASRQGDLIRRAYWHCAIMEASLHMELDLPLTQIIGLDDGVGMPTFNGPYCERDFRGNQSSNFEQHHISQVALRRLCSDLHESLRKATSSSDNSSDSGPSASTINSLFSEIIQWRNMLPRDLQWPEDDPAGFPSSQAEKFGSYPPSLDPNLPQLQQHREPLFTTNLNSDIVHYPYAYDIQVALLRTRYYYAKFMAHRPFVYKALHFPDQMTEEDVKGVFECLQSCLKWPLTLFPVSCRKRLVPYLFCWSQIFMSILLIFRLTQHDPTLRNIRERYGGARFEADAGVSVDLMIDWIRDLKDSDPLAKWCYQILQPV